MKLIPLVLLPLALRGGVGDIRRAIRRRGGIQVRRLHRRERPADTHCLLVAGKGHGVYQSILYHLPQ